MCGAVLCSRLEVWSAEGGQLERGLAHKGQRFQALLQRFLPVMQIGTQVRALAYYKTRHRRSSSALWVCCVVVAGVA